MEYVRNPLTLQQPLAFGTGIIYSKISHLSSKLNSSSLVKIMFVSTRATVYCMYIECVVSCERTMRIVKIFLNIRNQTSTTTTSITTTDSAWPAIGPAGHCRGTAATATAAWTQPRWAAARTAATDAPSWAVRRSPCDASGTWGPACAAAVRAVHASNWRCCCWRRPLHDVAAAVVQRHRVGGSAAEMPDRALAWTGTAAAVGAAVGAGSMGDSRQPEAMRSWAPVWR